MTTIATVSISEYANAVRTALYDLPSVQSRAILEGLDEHLAEIASEGSEDLEASLGTPQAYAAELRASAGFEAHIVEPLAKPAPAEPAVLPESNKSTFSLKHGRLMARVVSVAAFGILAIMVIRISHPLNGIELIVGALLAAGGWWVLRKVCRKADFPPALETRLPAGLAVAALVIAALIGGGFAGNKAVYVRVTSGDQRAPRPISTPSDPFGRPDVGRRVPNLIGESFENAVPMLASLGLRAELGANQGGVSIVAMNPGSGTLVPFDTVIVLTTGITPAIAPTPLIGVSEAIPSTNANPITSTPATEAISPLESQELKESIPFTTGNSRALVPITSIPVDSLVQTPISEPLNAAKLVP